MGGRKRAAKLVCKLDLLRSAGIYRRLQAVGEQSLQAPKPLPFRKNYRIAQELKQKMLVVSPKQDCAMRLRALG